MVRIILEKDIKEVVKIHSESLPQDFLPSLGIDFLAKIFYPNTLNSPFGITFVKTIDGEVAGFLTLAYKSNLFLKSIILKNFYRTIIIFFKKMFSTPLFLRECLDIFFQVFLKEKQEYKNLPEIVVIAVKKNFRGIGVGQELVNYVKEHLKNKGFNKLFVKTLTSNLSAIKLYKKTEGEIREEIIRANKKYNVVLFNL